MNGYINHLKEQYEGATFKRKMDYIDYNFGKAIKRLKPKSSKVLEIGPGMGECVKYLRGKGFRNIDVVDNDKSVLDKVSKLGVKNKYLTDDLLDLRNTLGKYDLIVLIQIMEHLPLNVQAKVISVLYSHLNKNGSLILVVPNANNPLGLAERYGDLQHTGAFTSRSLRDLVDDSAIKNYEAVISGFEIPPYSAVNLIRIILQKILHAVLYLMMIVNGGVFFKVMTPNIVLNIRKKD